MNPNFANQMKAQLKQSKEAQEQVTPNPEQTGQSAPDQETQTQSEKNVGGRPTFGQEARSRKVRLLLTPTLHDQIKEAAAQQHRSVNDYIFSILEEKINN